MGTSPPWGAGLVKWPTPNAENVQGSGQDHPTPGTPWGSVLSRNCCLPALWPSTTSWKFPTQMRVSHLGCFAPDSYIVRPSTLQPYLELSLQALCIFKDPSWKLSMASVQSN